MKEDYCGFEIAKLLKEKGFDEPCACCYKDDNLKTIWNDTFGEVSPQDWNNLSEESYNCIGLGSWFGSISVPNIQKTMKWLRKKHNIHITIDCDICDSFDFYSIIRIKSEESWKTYVEYEDEGSNTYEEAVEKAVEYCLTNLI